MELTNLGTALKFAATLETLGQETFEKEAQSTTQSDLKDLFLSFSNRSKKRKGMLEALYKESVYSDQDTGIFEPIAGLTSTDYLIPTTGKDEKPLGNLTRAMEMEEKARQFYIDFAAVMKSRRRALSKKFEDMANENSTRKQKLISLQSLRVERG